MLRFDIKLINQRCRQTDINALLFHAVSLIAFFGALFGGFFSSPSGLTLCIRVLFQPFNGLQVARWFRDATGFEDFAPVQGLSRGDTSKLSHLGDIPVVDWVFRWDK